MTNRANKILKPNTLIKKIIWRVYFVVFRSFGMDPSVILYTIFPFIRRQSDFRQKILVKKGFVKLDKLKSLFIHNNLSFYYKDSFPFGDFVSIFLSNDPYIKKNFISNPAFKLEGSYENENVFIEKGDVVIDAGANIGLFSVYASVRVGDSGKVFAFEPVAETRAILEQNLKKNNIKNVIVVPHALDNKLQNRVFSINNKELGASSAIFLDGDKKITVSAIKLDDFVRENSLKKINFIKADIEGMERYLLDGAKETIKNFKPKISICTYHLPNDPAVIRNLISSYVPQYEIFETRTKIISRI